MENFNSWSDAFIGSLQNLWFKMIAYLPQLLGALLVLVIGLILSSMLARFAKKLFGFTRLDAIAKRIGLKKEMEGVGLSFEFSDVIAWVVKWFFIIATFIAVADILKIPQVTNFLERIALYVPNVLVAVILLSIGLVAGRFFENLIRQGLKTTSMSGKTAELLSTLAKWDIYVFAAMAALLQMGVAQVLIQTLFAGMVFMLALAGGLAFGLGGRDAAKNTIHWAEKELFGGKRE